MFPKSYSIEQYIEQTGDVEKKGISDFLQVIESFKIKSDPLNAFWKSVSDAKSIDDLERLMADFLKANDVRSRIPMHLRPYLMLGPVIEEFLRKRLKFVREKVALNLVYSNDRAAGLKLHHDLTGDPFEDGIDSIIAEFDAAKRFDDEVDQFITRLDILDRMPAYSQESFCRPIKAAIAKSEEEGHP